MHIPDTSSKFHPHTHMCSFPAGLYFFHWYFALHIEVEVFLSNSFLFSWSECEETTESLFRTIQPPPQVLTSAGIWWRKPTLENSSHLPYCLLCSQISLPRCIPPQGLQRLDCPENLHWNLLTLFSLSGKGEESFQESRFYSIVILASLTSLYPPEEDRCSAASHQ